MFDKQKQYRKIMIILVLVLLIGFLLYYLWPYINGFFRAFILFTLFLPVHKLLTNKLKIHTKLSAVMIIILTVIIVVIPGYFILKTAYDEVSNISQNLDTSIDKIIDFNNILPSMNLTESLNKNIPKIADWSGDLLVSGISSAIKTTISLVIMYFLLFYLLLYHKTLKQKLKEFLPFKEKNANILTTEFRKVTYATVISTGLVAIFQGILFSLGFWFFGIKGVVFWGLLAAIFSFLPVVGIPIIWIPFAIYYGFIGNYFIAIGLVIWGLIINYSEYLIRPALQKRMGDLHPLTSIIGIFVGIAAFGIVGIVIGPLLISYFILIFRMFKEEYL